MMHPTPRQIHAHLMVGGEIERRSTLRTPWVSSADMPAIADRPWLGMPNLDEPFPNYRLVPIR